MTVFYQWFLFLFLENIEQTRVNVIISYFFIFNDNFVYLFVLNFATNSNPKSEFSIRFHMILVLREIEIEIYRKCDYKYENKKKNGDKILDEKKWRKYYFSYFITLLSFVPPHTHSNTQTHTKHTIFHTGFPFIIITGNKTKKNEFSV